MANIQDIMRANQEAGFHFFEGDTLRFFNSKIYLEVFEGTGGIFFVTSERAPHDDARKYTVRQFNKSTGAVSTVGEFNTIKSLRTAKKLAKELAEKTNLN